MTAKTMSGTKSFKSIDRSTDKLMVVRRPVVPINKINKSRTLSELVTFFNTGGQIEHIIDEYRAVCRADIKHQHRVQSTHQGDSRYCDIVCFDRTRVKLTQYPHGDFIHANWVDGLKKGDRRFIVTQGPMRGYLAPFWSMVWEYGCRVIMCLCKVGGARCDLYFPHKLHGTLTAGDIKIETVGIVDQDWYNAIALDVHRTGTKETGRRVLVLLLHTWEDRTVANLQRINHIIDVMRLNQENMAETYKFPVGNAIVVHCSAGVGRSGTLVAIDVLRDELRTAGTVSVVPTVLRMRAQRHQMVQRPLQFLMLYMAIIDYAMREKMLDPADIHPEQLFVRDIERTGETENHPANNAKQ